jgi:hypothetical protein
MRSQKIPLGKICYQTRDDVQLRTHVLLTRDRKSWNNFIKGANEHGIHPRSYESFLDLYQNIRVEGIKEPIRVQKIGDLYYIEDGAHRVAVARSLGHPTIEAFVVSDCGMPSVFLSSIRSTVIPVTDNNPRILTIFKYLSPDVIEKISNLVIASDSAPISMMGTAILWPTAKHVWNEMLDDIKQFHTVETTKVMKVSSFEHMRDLTVDLYKSDDVAQWKVEAKFPYFMSRDSVEYLAVYFTIDDARHRIKNKTGNEISMAIEDLKSHIRKKYRGKIHDYPANGQPDLLIHAGDNEYQTKEIRRTVEEYFENNK